MSVHTTKLPSTVAEPVTPIVVQTTTPTAAPARRAVPAPNADDVPFLGTDDGPPRFEPWLGVTLLTFVPGSLIFFLPHAILTRALIPICIAMTVFFFAGFGMLLRDRNVRRASTS
jgi:hypothetical protein